MKNLRLFLCLLLSGCVTPEIQRTDSETNIISQCREVCTNSDVYDPDMEIVQSCERILAAQNLKCFGD